MQLVDPESPVGTFLEVLAGLRQGRTLEEIARELRISSEVLGLWVKGLDILASTNRVQASESPDQRELQRLRQENEYLRKQRDLYRRACGLISPPLTHRDADEVREVSAF